MPIRRYVEKGAVFTPQAISAMSKALEGATEILGIAPDGKQRQAVAKFIIRLAQEDGSLDAAALRDRGRSGIGRRRVLRPSGNPPALKSPPKRRVTVSFMTTKPARLTAERSPAQDGRETMRGANERLVGGDRDQRSSGVRT
jgi:hypothetical protein